MKLFNLLGITFLCAVGTSLPMEKEARRSEGLDETIAKLEALRSVGSSHLFRALAFLQGTPVLPWLLNETAQLFEHDYPIRSAYFNDTDSRIVTSGLKRILEWHVSTGHRINSAGLRKVDPALQPDQSLAQFIPGKPFGQSELAMVEQYSHIAIIKTGKKIRDFYHNAKISALAVDPTGRYIVSGGSDGSLKVWDLQRERELFSVEAGSQGAIKSICFNQSGSQFLYIDEEGEVNVLEIGTGILTRLQRAAGQQIFNSVAFHPQVTHFATGSSDGFTIKDVQTGTVIYTNKFAASSVAFDKKGELIAVGLDNGFVNIHDLTGAILYSFDAHSRPVCSVAFDIEGRLLTAALDSRVVKLWDLPFIRLLAKDFSLEQTILMCHICKTCIQKNPGTKLTMTDAQQNVFLSLPEKVQKALSKFVVTIEIERKQ